MTITFYALLSIMKSPYNTNALNTFDFIASQVAGVSIAIGLLLYQQ